MATTMAIVMMAMIIPMTVMHHDDDDNDDAEDYEGLFLSPGVLRPMREGVGGDGTRGQGGNAVRTGSAPAK